MYLSSFPNETLSNEMNNDDEPSSKSGGGNAHQQRVDSDEGDRSWLKKTLIGRTPSLPTSLGKKKQSFLKKLQSRKISAPSFALRPSRTSSNNSGGLSGGNPNGNLASNEGRSSQYSSLANVNGSFHIGSGNSSSCSSINQSQSGTPDVRRRHCGAPQDNYKSTTSPSPATPPIDSAGWFSYQYSDKQPPITSTPIKFNNVDEATAFVEELREKYRLQGAQLVLYRKKMRLQKTEINNLRASQRRQLEEISSQLILFESSLRNKEKTLESTLQMKDQVILKQQRVIKHLLKKERGNRGEEGIESASQITPTSISGSGSDLTQSEPIFNFRRKGGGVISSATISQHSQSGAESETAIRSDPEIDFLHDSDSAPLSEDQNITEVSLSVPNLLTTTTLNKFGGSRVEENSSVVPIVLEDTERRKKDERGRKSKEERRISNRQKLMSLKRHSGYLKRPEILETVYSVEEDAEQQKQNEGGNTSTMNTSSEDKENENTDVVCKPSNEEEGEEAEDEDERQELHQSSNTDKSSSKGHSFLCRSSFRSRFDSDLNCSDPEYSTDDDSNRIFFSETDVSASCCTCSRRSSYCYCSSRTESRRSSYGSHANLCSTLSQGEEEKMVLYNRVMTNHKSALKPKDIKFKRINKSRSKSLEELRGKLRCQIIEKSGERKGSVMTQHHPGLHHRKAGVVRGMFIHSASLDQDT